MINKRIKEGIKKAGKPGARIRFSLGTIAVMAFCLMLLITATFTSIKTSFNIPESSVGTTFRFEYIPQIPVVLFIAALLGEVWGTLTILIYIIAGLTPYFPVFALGGGPGYIFQYNFGYIFGFLVAVMLAAKRLKKGTNLLNLVLATLIGIVAIHLTGIIYLTVIALLRHDSLDFITNMIYYQSVSKLLYDVVFGFMAVLIGRGCRKLLRFVSG